MSVRVLQAGLLSTVQDLGRVGHQHDGIPVAGAMDAIALRLANMLVGNDDGAAGIEMTLVGARLQFDAPALVAITGADVDARVDATRVPAGRAMHVPAGATLALGEAARGCRAYLAIAGGVNVPVVLGSRSTSLRGAFGGLGGRALRRNDVIPIGVPTALSGRIREGLALDRAPVAIATWGASSALVPRYSRAPAVRLLAGEHLEWLTSTSRDALFRAEFRVGAQSDRMGFRLEGTPLELTRPLEILSEAVAFGTLQLPPGGDPIMLMADRQTTGGYPRIGEVASIDRSLVAQLRPGDRLRFVPISLDDAQSLYLAREADLLQARTAIALRHA